MRILFFFFLRALQVCICKNWNKGRSPGRASLRPSWWSGDAHAALDWPRCVVASFAVHREVEYIDRQGRIPHERERGLRLGSPEVEAGSASQRHGKSRSTDRSDRTAAGAPHHALARFQTLRKSGRPTSPRVDIAWRWFVGTRIRSTSRRTAAVRETTWRSQSVAFPHAFAGSHASIFYFGARGEADLRSALSGAERKFRSAFTKCTSYTRV